MQVDISLNVVHVFTVDSLMESQKTFHLLTEFLILVIESLNFSN